MFTSPFPYKGIKSTAREEGNQGTWMWWDACGATQLVESPDEESEAALCHAVNTYTRRATRLKVGLSPSL